MFHGLEGSSQSHYARAFAWYCQHNNIDFCVPHFRGCSGEPNRLPRAYHSGDWEEINWILQRIKQQNPDAPLVAIGVSLGGNALMRWAGEVQTAARASTSAVVSICAPLDLAAAGHHLDAGLNRWLYTKRFMDTMIPASLKRLDAYPNLYDRAAVAKCKTFYAFDNLVTAPLHGFKSTEDYWLRASALPHMRQICVPALAINALNDPFIPAASLPQSAQVSPWVELWQPRRGGHVGFVSGIGPHFTGHLQQLPERVAAFTGRHMRGEMGKL
jgi:predicted alpha/beta-fold hydrolase